MWIIQMLNGVGDCHEMYEMNFYVLPRMLREYYTFSYDSLRTNYCTSIMFLNNYVIVIWTRLMDLNLPRSKLKHVSSFSLYLYRWFDFIFILFLVWFIFPYFSLIFTLFRLLFYLRMSQTRIWTNDGQLNQACVILAYIFKKIIHLLITKYAYIWLCDF